MAGAVKGLGAIKEVMNKSTQNLKIADGEHAVVRILTPADEIIGLYEHTEQFNGNWRTVTCLGKSDCPLCQAGKRGGFKAYLVVADRTDGDKVKIFKASKTVTKQLLGLVEEYGDLTKRDFKIARSGQKLETTYQFFPRDPQEYVLPEGAELPNIEELVAPMAKDAILALMNGGSVADVEEKKEEDSDDYPF